ncbi:MAG: ABC transporter ATP-binding protein [Candidatus Omnitrophica bacterium]|nr:ABC transporter ATP-binding protein [Candidatus Omnitrophota bacterium]
MSTGEDMMVEVKNVSKKYCRDFRASMRYGISDIADEIILKERGLTRLRPHEFLAVKDVSFKVSRGECVGLVGPNGAGKSTLLKMMNGLIKPDAGEICVKGRTGALIELGAGFSPILTGRENIYVNAAVLGLSKKETDKKLEGIIEFSGIGDFIEAPVQSYSSGMKVRLAFSVAAALEPDVLLVDEVLAVGDTGFRMKCFGHILNLIKKGAAVIVVSHNMIDISRVAGRMIVIDAGVSVFQGNVDEGISAYQGLFIDRRSSFVVSRSLDENKADGPRFGEIMISNISGERTNKFKTHDDIILDISIKSNVEVPGGRMIAHIEAPELGILGAFGTPYKNFKFDIKKGETKIRLVLLDIPLLMGMYHMHIDLYGSGVTDFFDRKIVPCAFEITGPKTDAFGFGACHTVDFKHSWSLNSEL